MHSRPSTQRRAARRCLLVMTVASVAVLLPITQAWAQSAAPPSTVDVAAPARPQGGREGARRVEATASLGFATFIDENFIEHVTAIGAVRVPLSERWSIEPRFAYMYGSAFDQDFYLLASFIYDLQTRGRFTPYWTVGAGVFWHRDGRIDFVSASSHLSGGFGVRVRLGESWALVSEARTGGEPIFQVHAGVGYSF